MRPIIITCFVLLAGHIISCGPANLTRYPSYDQVISKYAPTDRYKGVQVDESVSRTPPDECDCPRIWYQNHWVYYYDGYWFYRYHDFWYYYPVFYVHYVDGVPRAYRGSTRSIRKGRRVGGTGNRGSIRGGGSPSYWQSDESNRPPAQTTTTHSIRKGGK